MTAGAGRLKKIRADLVNAIRELDQADAPSGIAAHIQMGVNRLDQLIKMQEKWKGSADSPWDG